MIPHAKNQDQAELDTFKKMIVNGISEIITSLEIKTFANTINALNNEVKLNKKDIKKNFNYMICDMSKIIFISILLM